ncbi:MAG: redoxin domain-containing protein [Planctomycetota bacterium]
MKLAIQVLLAFTSPVALFAENDAKAASPAQAYRAILKDYNVVAGGFRKAKTDAERKAVADRLDPFAPKFLDLAEKHADDPVALDALRMAVQAVVSRDSFVLQSWDRNETHLPLASTHKAPARTSQILRAYVDSKRIIRICDRMRYSVRNEYAEFLRSVLRTNPHREVQAVACLSLAQSLIDRLRAADLGTDHPKMATCHAELYGKDFPERAKRKHREKLNREIESLLERAAQYSDIEAPNGGTVAQRARRQIYDQRYLAAGKTAPDIAGLDQDGTQFKLSDYRGQIVLLYFWMEL